MLALHLSTSLASLEMPDPVTLWSTLELNYLLTFYSHDLMHLNWIWRKKHPQIKPIKSRLLPSSKAFLCNTVMFGGPSPVDVDRPLWAGRATD